LKQRSAVSLASLLAVSAIGIAAASARTSETPYALRASTVCLQHRGAVVGRVIATNRRLRALRDLAQKTSRQARLGKVVVGMAFTRSTSDASFLVELLSVPRDPLRLEQRRNVVLLSPKSPTRARLLVLACLRT
jgi:hypothetical protein